MRRRITFALLGTVAAALLLTGLGTLVLTRLQVRRTTQSDLRAEAQAFVSLASLDVRPRAALAADRTQLQQARLNAVRQKLKLADATILVYAADNTVFSGVVPASVPSGQLDPSTLRLGTTLSGSRARVVWAAAPSRVDAKGRFLVIVLSRQIPFGLGSVQWLFLTGGVVLLLAVGISLRLSRALIAPLRAADLATRRIADGDLSARVPEPPASADDELADLSRAINSMAGALDRSRGLEQQFLMSVSHDLRTPLTSIRGYAEAITDGATTDPGAAASVILGEARRLERLVHDLLDLARLDAHQFSLDLQPVDLVALAATATEGFRPAASAAGLTLVASTPPGSVAWVSADPDRLAQVVANLIENGLRFAQHRLDVSVGAGPGTVALTVTDDGSGIAAHDLPHVFERLYVAAAQPVRRESGSGLGLTIARELVTAMGGTITVQSAPAQGTRFVVTLPALPVSG